MTQEEKELLLTDLCTRILYGVICLNKVTKEVYKLCYVTSYNEISLDDRTAVFYSPDDIIPYLRPMSSMTKEEINEFHKLRFRHINYGSEPLQCVLSIDEIEWLNSHHFDYHNLIEKGLALVAPKDMYI